MRRGILAGLLLLLPPVSAQAQDAEDEETICVESSNRWQAGPEDVRQIEAIPVLASYRRRFESADPCVRWNLDQPALVDWHMRFGSAESAGAALAYLERGHLRGIPDADRYPALVRAAYRAALPDLRTAAKLEQPPGLTYSVAWRFYEHSRTAMAFRELIRRREDFLFLAGQYLRAAEEFGALDLLVRAERYIKLSDSSAVAIEPLLDDPLTGDLVESAFDRETLKLDDFRERAALTRARATRRAEDIATARQVVLALEKPAYFKLAQVAFSGGEGFCDIAEGWGAEADIARAACAGPDDDIAAKVLDHMVNRALLDLLLTGQGDESGWRTSFEAATRLLGLERAPGHQQRCCGRSAEEDLLRLWCARAEYFARRVRLGGDSASKSGDWWNALQALRTAADLAPPADAPGRFARIADEWLRLWNGVPAWFAEPENRAGLAGDPALQRFAAYLDANRKAPAAGPR